MLITKTSFNTQRGEFIDRTVELVSDFETVYGQGNWQILKNASGDAVVRFRIQNSEFEYQKYNTGDLQWDPPCTLPSDPILSQSLLGQPNGIATLDANG